MCWPKKNKVKPRFSKNKKLEKQREERKVVCFSCFTLGICLGVTVLL